MMKFLRLALPLSRGMPPMLLCLFFGMAARASEPAFDLCYAACASGACQLSQPNSSETPALTLEARYIVISSCQTRTVKKGPVLLRYRHKQQWFNPPAALQDGTAIASLMARFKPDVCPVPTPDCLQANMEQKVAAIGGHGIDGQVSHPGGSGRPCAIGLPCGRVAVPADAWQFALADPSLQGRWRVRLARGSPPPGVPSEAAFSVVDGVVHADGTWFSPGTSYTYQLLDGAGASLAGGEFSLLSRPLMAALRRIADQRVAAGQDAATAWIDALAANELDWDAHQAVLQPR